jgi:hypothetical protein
MRSAGQSVEEAKRLRDEFVLNTLKQARNSFDAGNKRQALVLFGEAIHPVMDYSSSLHTDQDGNPIEWKGLHHTSSWAHSPFEFWGKETAKSITPEILAFQHQKLNEAFRQVFGMHKVVGLKLDGRKP